MNQIKRHVIITFLDVGKDEYTYGNLVLRYVGAIHLFCCVRTVRVCIWS